MYKLWCHLVAIVRSPRAETSSCVINSDYRFVDAEFASSDLLNIVSCGNRGSISANKCSARQRIQVIVLRGVSGTFEHVQHPLGDQETT